MRNNFFESGSYYGVYNTRKFSDVFPNVEKFRKDYEHWVPQEYRFTDNSSLNTIFFVLFGRYGNSHLANAIDESQFIAETMSILFQYGTTWEVKLKTQKKIRAWQEEDILTGASEKHNAGYNPAEALSNPDEDILTINQQNRTTRKKDKMNSYAMWMAMLDTDFTEELVGRFARLFSKFGGVPVGTTLYTTYKTED